MLSAFFHSEYSYAHTIRAIGERCDDSWFPQLYAAAIDKDIERYISLLKVASNTYELPGMELESFWKEVERLVEEGRK